MAVRKLSSFEIVVLCLVAIIIALGFIFIYTSLPLFERYIQEDGVIEWLTVLGLLAASVLSLYRGITLFRKKRWFFITTNLILGVLLFMAAGEEISWGQRIFGIETPAYFKEKNLQGETNLHNLKINGFEVNRIIFSYVLIGALVIYLAIFPLLYHRKKGMKNFIDSWGIPLPQLYQIIGFLAVFIITAFIPHGKRAELLECGAALLFYLIIRYPANKAIFKKSNAGY